MNVSTGWKTRMTMAEVKKGKVTQAWRALAYGVEGIGKSTLGAAAPSPVFLGAEDGTAHLDVARFPTPQHWADVKESVMSMAASPGDYKTYVVDTVDHLEPMLWAYICERDGMANIEAYGYGKGYQAALDEWRVYLRLLEQLRPAGVNVLLLGHCHVRPFKNPEGEDFDRYELKLHLKAGGLLKEWVDMVLFANHEIFAKKDERTKRVRGISTGARLLHTTRSAAFDAKNRFGLPEMLPLSWPDVEAAMAAHQIDRAALLAEIKRKAAELGEEKAVTAAITRAGDDVSKLMQLNTWCNSKLTLKAEPATPKKEG